MKDVPTSLRSLRVDRLLSFIATIELGGFSAAARHLNYPQPHVSKHIAELERLVGARLIDRSVRPPRLTARGEEVVLGARRIIEEVAEMGRDLEDCNPLFLVGMYPSAAALIFPRAAEIGRERAAPVDLRLWEGMPLELTEALRAGVVDLTVQPDLGEDDEAFDRQELWTERLVLVAPEEDHLVQQETLSLADLEGRSLISMGAGRSGSVKLPYEVSVAFRRAEIEPRVVFQTDLPQTLVSMVSSGMGLGLSNALAMKTVNTDGLRIREFEEDYCVRRVSARWPRPRGTVSPSLRIVLDCLKHAARSITDGSEAR